MVRSDFKRRALHKKKIGTSSFHFFLLPRLSNNLYEEMSASA
jgi:hypothetical protein